MATKKKKRRSLKCTSRKFCDAMSSQLNAGENPRSKGLGIVYVYNFETCKGTTIGVAYKTKASDRGLLLNYCPWCGEKFEPEEALKRIRPKEKKRD